MQKPEILPKSARNLQTTIIQDTLRYTSELTIQSTPLGRVMAESKMALARPLLDFRRAKFAQAPWPALGCTVLRKTFWREEAPDSPRGYVKARSWGQKKSKR